MEEREALHRCLSGDRNAFATIVQRYQSQVLAHCLRMLGNREDAADAAQQAFILAYRRLATHEPDQPFRPWLFRIATNVCIDLYRRRRRQADPVEDEVLERTTDPGEDVPTLAELTEDRERVRRAVAALPEKYRTLVVLYYFEGLSYQEIAGQTGLSIGTISTQLHRAKQRLRKQLTEEGVDKLGTRRCREAAAISGR